MLQVKKNNPNIEEISKQISMHIAATDPKSLDIESLNQSLIEKEREIFRDQLKSTNKPPDIIKKILWWSLPIGTIFCYG